MFYLVTIYAKYFVFLSIEHLLELSCVSTSVHLCSLLVSIVFLQLVKDLKVKTFGITYHVWFVVMDFENPIDSYDIILGRPFLRIASM